MRQTWNQALYLVKGGFLNLSRFSFGKPALAIMLVAILHSLLYLPLKIRNARQNEVNRQKLAKLKSERQAIEEKYQPEPGEQLSAAQVAQRGNEIKELYQGEGVTFNIGCASVILPTLSGLLLHQALNTIKDDERFKEGGILWFKDITRPDRYFILPLTQAGIAFLRQRLIPADLAGIEQVQPVLARRARTLLNWIPLLVLPVIFLRRKQPSAAYMLYQVSFTSVELAEDLLVKRLVTNQG